MARVGLEDLSRHFGRTAAVDGVSLDVMEGEFVCVLGPSGCGKTTLLRLVAGLEMPDAGRILFDGTVVSEPGGVLPPERRGAGVVFQSYALWPHMTVAENAAFPMRAAGLPAAERRRRLGEALAAVRLEDYAERKPHTLSGGQQQRVALARCLTQRPKVVLMDEPLANLDVHLREEMLLEFRRFHDATGATMIYITHDQAEAMSIADRIAVMHRGRLIQVAQPERLYAEPADATVAGFIGVSTVLEGVVAEGAATASVGPLAVPLAARGRALPGARVALCIRPEQIALGDGPAAAVVGERIYLGDRYRVALAVDGLATPLVAYADRPLEAGETVPFRIREAWPMAAG